MTNVVIDIECFRHRNYEWIVKEIAVYGDYLDSMTFQPTQPFNTLPEKVQKAYLWLTNNFHGLDWNSGDYSYKRLPFFVESIKLRYPESVFFAKGFEKSVFLSKLFERQFIDLDDLRCPRLNQLSDCGSQCVKNSTAHSLSNHCARKKAHTFGIWLEKYSLKHGEFEGTVIEGIDNFSLNN